MMLLKCFTNNVMDFNETLKVFISLTVNVETCGYSAGLHGSDPGPKSGWVQTIFSLMSGWVSGLSFPFHSARSCEIRATVLTL